MKTTWARSAPGDFEASPKSRYGSYQLGGLTDVAESIPIKILHVLTVLAHHDHRSLNRRHRRPAVRTVEHVVARPHRMASFVSSIAPDCVRWVASEIIRRSLIMFLGKD
jgi:hypothetical protein